MVMTKKIGLAWVLLGLAAVAPAHEGGDILVAVESGRIATGTVDEDGSNAVIGERVFGSEFDDPGDALFIDEPGHLGLPGTFDPDERTGFNILSSLKSWTGSGFVNLNPDTEEDMVVSFGSLNRRTTDGFVSGFFINNDADGGWHHHLGFRLGGANGDELNPRIGVYMLELELKSTDTSLGNSLPYYIIFNYGASEDDHDAAIDYQRNAVPEPASIVALIFGAGIWARRRTK